MTEHGHELGHGGHFDDERVAVLLEGEGRLTSGLAAEAIARCAERFAERAVTVERVVDLGSGPGLDTALLAERFPGANVVAADGSAAMLARVKARATRLGLAGRVRTCEVDLDGDLQGVGSCDLVWSAMAVHHAEDEVATLRRMRDLVRPRGLVCLLERADPTSVRLADDLGRPGIWDRLDEARTAWYERARPTLAGALNAERYPGMLASAGLEPIASGTLTDTVTSPPDDPAIREFLEAQLRATARNLADIADVADIEALGAFVDAIRPRLEGATVTSSRRLLIAQPAGERP